ncbi:aspartate kinase [Poronia punctata]|nr:aspartate kinase [Poronia punctata]
MVAATSTDKPWLVQKYGGTSLGKLANTICGSIIPDYARNHRLVVVCSALSGNLKANGTTSLLLECIALAEAGIEAQKQLIEAVHLIRENHLGILDSIFSAQGVVSEVEVYDVTKSAIVRECENLTKFLLAAQVVGDLSPRSRDRIISLGEKLACIVIAACLTSKGIPARPVVLDDVVAAAFGPSVDEQIAAMEKLGSRFYRVLAEEIATRIDDCHGAIPIVTGFFGIMPNSLIQTVGRGYSDLCAALCAVAVGAAELQIWKEVDGIFTADPRKIPSAQLLSSVTADEATELTYYGSEVIHPLTMDQICEANIALRLKNVFKPHGQGTVIDPSTPAPSLGMGQISRNMVSPPGVLLKNDFSVGRFERRRPTAVTVKDDILLINVICNRYIKSGGLLIQVFQRLERNKIPVDLIATSERNVSLAVHSPGNMSAVMRLQEELQSFGKVAIAKNMSIVTIVGNKMRSHSGVANDTLTALAAANVNIHLISQGASEISISLVVNADDATSALNAIHREVLKIPTLEESRFRRSKFFSCPPSNPESREC